MSLVGDDKEHIEIEVLVNADAYWRITYRTNLVSGVRLCCIEHRCASLDEWSSDWIWGEKVQYCKKCMRPVAEEVEEKWLVLSLDSPGSPKVFHLP